MDIEIKQKTYTPLSIGRSSSGGICITQQALGENEEGEISEDYADSTEIMVDPGAVPALIKALKKIVAAK